MWIKIQKQKPPGIGAAYTCYGSVNRGTLHETRTHFIAYWQGEEYGWTDKDGEDLIGINESVEYWFDFSKVEPPTSENYPYPNCDGHVGISAFSIHDLKCGNILNYDTGEEIITTVIDWQDLKCLDENPDDFNKSHSPIPLTEELLLKLGFSDEEYKGGYIGKDFKSGNMILDFVLTKPLFKGPWQNYYTFDFEGARHIKIEFVHELQNFYYCIAGEMLSLNHRTNGRTYNL
jgi:hypothetical protein